jgi:hypothetical protein
MKHQQSFQTGREYTSHGSKKIISDGCKLALAYIKYKISGNICSTIKVSRAKSSNILSPPTIKLNPDAAIYHAIYSFMTIGRTEEKQRVGRAQE